MDIEDANALFDGERVKRRLSLLFVQHLGSAVQEYTDSDRFDPEEPDKDKHEVNLLVLQDAVADLVAENNRALWGAVEQLLAEQSPNNAQS